MSASSPSKAADYVDPGCTLSGSVMAGYMHNWQSHDAGEISFDVDWTTPFGEGAGLVTCGAFNLQADVAYYAHSGSLEQGGEDRDRTNSHIGGALFYRDPANWAGGIQASWISQSVASADIDVYRAGLFGEFYLDDVFTLGAAAAYHSSDRAFDGFLDEDGFELAAYGRFYATPDFSLLLRGDLLLADAIRGGEGDRESFAITGEAEYLVWDQGLSLFGGARYAEEKFDGDDFNLDIEDMQAFVGIKFHFGQDGSLIERQRTAPVDNTSLFKEKLPNTLLIEGA